MNYVFLIMPLIIAYTLERSIPYCLEPNSGSRIAKGASFISILMISYLPVIPRSLMSFSLAYLLFILYAFIFYRDNATIKIAFGTIFFSIISIWSFMSVSASIRLKRSSLSPAVQNLIAFAFAVVFIAFFMHLGQYIRRMQCRKHIKAYSKRMWTYTSVLAFSPLLIEFLLMYFFPRSALLSACFSLAALAVTSVLFPLINQLGRSAMLQEENARLSSRNDYYKEVENQQEQLRKLKHDLMNHFTVVATYLDLGENEKAIEYFKKIGAEYANLTRSFTGNTLLNAILNSKYQKALANEIHMEVEAHADDIKADETDICTLIANSLDNAIEALSGTKGETIEVELRESNGVFTYSVSNRIIRPVSRDSEGRFISGKEDKKNHGLGIKNMERAAERLGGTLEITTEGNVFRLKAEFPNQRNGQREE